MQETSGLFCSGFFFFFKHSPSSTFRQSNLELQGVYLYPDTPRRSAEHDRGYPLLSNSEKPELLILVFQLWACEGVWWVVGGWGAGSGDPSGFNF